MDKGISILIELDTRRQKKDSTYPVKLRLYNPETRRRKRYSTIFSFTEKDFTHIWLSVKPRKNYKDNRDQLQALVTRAKDVVKELPSFNFEDFERLMFNKVAGKVLNVDFYFQKTIDRKNKRGQTSTATSYKNAFDCLIRYRGKPNLSFKEITVSFLEKFEKYCRQSENKTTATIGIYLRNLRAIYNMAIRDKVISRDLYPFGRGKYEIKRGARVNKALNRKQINTLFNGTPQTPEQKKAKGFWFFSYLCNGMNFKDILNLKYKNLTKETVSFIRAKTANSNHNPRPIKVFLHPFAKQVIETYGNPDKTPENFVFDVLSVDLTPEQANRKKQNFIRYVNQHFLKYAHSVGIKERVSTYWARHSFSTTLLRKGKSVALIGEALGHTDIKTTMNYLAGFEDEDKREIVNALLD